MIYPRNTPKGKKNEVDRLQGFWAHQAQAIRDEVKKRKEGTELNNYVNTKKSINNANEEEIKSKEGVSI